MLRPLTLVVVSIGVLLAAACSSKSVWVDVDEAYDFRGRRTYAWSEVVPVPNELMQRRIEGWIDEELGARGLTRVEEADGAAAPDLYVTTEFGARQEVRSTGGSATVGVSRRAGRGRVGMGTTMGNQIYEVSIGTLVIALFDSGTDALVWRARADKTLGKDPQANGENARKAIAKAFEEYPVPAAPE